jgi:hypothetical protein
VLPLLYLCWIGVRHTVPRVTLEEPQDILFTDVTVPAGAELDTEASSTREVVEER